MGSDSLPEFPTPQNNSKSAKEYVDRIDIGGLPKTLELLTENRAGHGVSR